MPFGIGPAVGAITPPDSRPAIDLSYFQPQEGGGECYARLGLSQACWKYDKRLHGFSFRLVRLVERLGWSSSPGLAAAQRSASRRPRAWRSPGCLAGRLTVSLVGFSSVFVAISSGIEPAEIAYWCGSQAHRGPSSRARLCAALRLHRDGARTLDRCLEFRRVFAPALTQATASPVCVSLPRGTCGAAVVRIRYCVTIALSVCDRRMCRPSACAALRAAARWAHGVAREVGVGCVFALARSCFAGRARVLMDVGTRWPSVGLSAGSRPAVLRRPRDARDGSYSSRPVVGLPL